MQSSTNSQSKVNGWPSPAKRLIERVDLETIESRVQRIARRDAAISPIDPTMKLDGMAGAAIDLACEQILEIEHPPLAAYQFNALYWSYIRGIRRCTSSGDSMTAAQLIVRAERAEKAINDARSLVSDARLRTPVDAKAKLEQILQILDRALNERDREELESFADVPLALTPEGEAVLS
jgi:hypothetical protein